MKIAMISAQSLLAWLLFCFSSHPSLARSVYINGTDVSSARNQYLKNVNLRIDEMGNILIEAPHYQVNEETTFTPLSRWVESIHTPVHKAPTNLRDTPALPDENREAPNPSRAPIPTEALQQPASNQPDAQNLDEAPREIEAGNLQDKRGSKEIGKIK